MNYYQIAKQRRYKPFTRACKWAHIMAVQAIFGGACEENEEALLLEARPTSDLTKEEILYWSSRFIERAYLDKGMQR